MQLFWARRAGEPALRASVTSIVLHEFPRIDPAAPKALLLGHGTEDQMGMRSSISFCLLGLACVAGSGCGRATARRNGPSPSARALASGAGVTIDPNGYPGQLCVENVVCF